MDFSRERITEKIQRIEQALLHLSVHEIHCTLCPHECRVNRSAGERGFCRSGNDVSVSHAILHFGEEPALSGYQGCQPEYDQSETSPAGSGTVFFTGCNLKCLFCQNYQLSWLCRGRELSAKGFAETLLELQGKGALNINLVSPMHMIIPILKGLKKAYERGLLLPLVYNTNAYEKASTLSYLEGIVDIYLPDLKYHSPQLAQSLSNTPDYFDHAGQAVKEMFRQRPMLHVEKNEVAQKGLIIRHLVLPGQVADSLTILEWTAKNISTKIGLSLMSQYVPCFRAPEEIRKKLTDKEYKQVVVRAEELGFEMLFIQPELFDQSEHLVPDFDQAEPFKWGKK